MIMIVRKNKRNKKNNNNNNKKSQYILVMIVVAIRTVIMITIPTILVVIRIVLTKTIVITTTIIVSRLSHNNNSNNKNNENNENNNDNSNNNDDNDHTTNNHDSARAKAFAYVPWKNLKPSSGPAPSCKPWQDQAHHLASWVLHPCFPSSATNVTTVTKAQTGLIFWPSYQLHPCSASFIAIIGSSASTSDLVKKDCTNPMRLWLLIITDLKYWSKHRIWNQRGDCFRAKSLNDCNLEITSEKEQRPLKNPKSSHIYQHKDET